jgi:hypothetical protein
MNAALNPRLVIVPRYGLGQTDSVNLVDTGGFITTAGTTVPSILPTTITPTATSPAGGGFNWTSFLTNLTNQAGATARASIAPLSVLPPGSSYFTSPYGTGVSVGGAAANPLASQLGLQNMMSSLTGMLPILLIVGGVVLVISMAGGRK